MATSSSSVHSVIVDLSYCRGRVGKIRSDEEFPIFVLTRDRLDTLRYALASYKMLSSRWQLIICDHHSTYPPMVKYLASLALTGIEVWHIKSESWEDALQEMASNISHYLSFRPHLKYYVITDPDISLNGTAPDILLFLGAVLDACPKVEVVGPALRISNIPDHYQKRDLVRKFETPYWLSVPATATWHEVYYHLAVQPIDTTFAIRRCTQRFKRLKGITLRAYAPYMATHIDWYHNSSHPTEDYLWYIKHQSDINHYR